MVKSVYDMLDIANSELDAIDPDMNLDIDLSDAKDQVSNIDDELQELEEQLDIVRDKFIDNEITLEEVNEFFDKTVQKTIEDIKAIRGRLY